MLEKRKLDETQFRRISEFVTKHYGIRLPIEKRVMVEGRLQKRLKASKIEEFKEYVDYVMSESGKYELLEMIDAISTNKTDFFREPAHFEFMTNHLLPEFVGKDRFGKLKVWSSASSSGEEIYTIAMVMEEFKQLSGNPSLDYSILGTDISVDILKKAVTAVYKLDRIENLSNEIRNKYFLRSKDRSKQNVRVVPNLRNKAKFERLNLMDDYYKVDNDFDLIFCRNVLIYFDRENQERVINKLCQKLKIGGYFFLGHSESIFGKDVPLKQIKPTIYKRI
ncbi:MAG: protein-glutamate O-methyltransferase CheR [Cyclobacteriaceae bacterium]